MWWGCFYGNALHLNADGLYLNLTDRPGQTFYSETVQRSSELFLSLTEDKNCPVLLQKHWSATAQFSSQLVVRSKMLCESNEDLGNIVEYSIVLVVFLLHFSDIELGFLPTGVWLNSNYECGLEPAKSYRACCSAWSKIMLHENICQLQFYIYVTRCRSFPSLAGLGKTLIAEQVETNDHSSYMLSNLPFPSHCVNFWCFENQNCNRTSLRKIISQQWQQNRIQRIFFLFVF